MEYTVVPFAAQINSNENVSTVAAQLQSVISTQAASGWEFVSFETVETHVAGSAGCFGFGATAPQVISVNMVVFRR